MATAADDPAEPKREEAARRATSAHPQAFVRLAEEELACRYPGAEILLAEDNEVNREVARLLLGRAGLVVEVARDGREAVAMARSKRYALVLMDVQMPHVDGLEATAAIRALPGWKQIPIVALTANSLVDDRRRCLEAGMNDHLPKPVDAGEFYRCLLQWLSGGAAATVQGSVPAVG